MATLLGNKNFMLFILSRCSANIGDSIYFIALLWSVQLSTDSTSATGFVYAALTLATLLGFLFGPVVDKNSPAVVAGVSLFAQSFIITVITIMAIFNHSSLFILIPLIFIASIFSTIFYPADNTLFTRIVEEDAYLKGNSFISSSDQIVNLIGFLLGGTIIAALGSTNTFGVSVMFLLFAGIIYLFLLNKNQQNRNLEVKAVNNESTAKENFRIYLHELKQGISFIKSNNFLRIILPFGIVSNAVMAILIIMLPSIGVKFGSPIYYSGIYVAFFIGFALGAILTNFLKTTGYTISLAWIGNSVSLFLFSLMDNWWLICLAILFFGMFSGVLNIIQNTLIQSMTPSRMMGRVMTALTTLNNLAMPLGSLVGGILAIAISLNSIIVISAFILFSCGISLLLVRKFRDFDLNQAKKLKSENTEGSLDF